MNFLLLKRRAGAGAGAVGSEVNPVVKCYKCLRIYRMSLSSHILDFVMYRLLHHVQTKKKDHYSMELGTTKLTKKKNTIKLSLVEPWTISGLAGEIF